MGRFFLYAACCALTVAMAEAKEQPIGPGDSSFRFAVADGVLEVEFPSLAEADGKWTVFIATGTPGSVGSSVIPYTEALEGSTVFLPFSADRVFALPLNHEVRKPWSRKWSDWKWSEPVEVEKGLAATVSFGRCKLRLPIETLGVREKVNLVIYSKDFTTEKRGRLIECSDPVVVAGEGDRYVPHFFQLDLKSLPLVVTRKGRLDSEIAKVRIYQLFVRLFGNANETRQKNGALAENGVGKFADVNEAALASLKQMGFTHIWLTGVLNQATASDYPEIGQPADDPDLLKGLAGSPYAIRDYFDVSPDYAVKPAERLNEFKALLDRLHNAGLKALIDFVPNHVARSYKSTTKPELTFGTKGRDGRGDDRSKFFDPNNNFFYLTPGADGPPLKLPTWFEGQPMSPTCKVAGLKCDGFFDGEREFGRVTGNNVTSWSPSLNDWYETVKLNYGYDFTDPSKATREYPNALGPDKPIPDTWRKMDAVISYWQALGVDGFRCDMSHMIPPEFWSWLVSRARARDSSVFFTGEAYDDDPAKVRGSDPVLAGLKDGHGNVLFGLLNAGFNAVYDAPAYRALKKIYEGPGWANDIDGTLGDEFISSNSLRYAENHDEARLAAKSEWGGFGAPAGPAISAVLFGLSRGAVMVYNGQEVAEPASGAEGFGGDDARTSIFDYWSMPEMVKWVNGHKFDGGRLSTEQKRLRASYSRLVNLVGEPAFRDGGVYLLNALNRDNPAYGRLPKEQPSGHWLYSFLRCDPETQQRFLAVVNLHPTEALKDIRIYLSPAGITFLGLDKMDPKASLTFTDRLGEGDPARRTTSITDLMTNGISIGNIEPATPLFFEIKDEH